MTNQIALLLGSLLLAGIGLDYYYNDWSALVFLLRKLTDLTEYLAFWR